MGKVKPLELRWQMYRTSFPVWDLENFRPMDFCWHECTYVPYYGATSQKTVIISNGFDYHSAGRPTSYATLSTDGKLFSCLFCSPSTYTLRLTTRRIRQANDPVIFHSMPRDFTSEYTRVTQCPFSGGHGQGNVLKWKACNRRAFLDSCNVQEHYKKDTLCVMKCTNIWKQTSSC